MSELVASVKEAADLLGVSDDLVYNLIADGLLPCVKFGGRRLVPRKAIDLIIERSLEGFDPDAVIARMTGFPIAAIADAVLAGAAHSSDGEHGMPSEGEWTGTTGPETRHPAARQAPAAPGTSRLRPLRSPPG